MRLHFTNPIYLPLLLALPGIVWLSWKSLADLGTWRKWTSLAIRLVILLALIFGLAGIQILRPTDSLSVFYLLDRSESIPASYLDAMLKFVNETAASKRRNDKAGVLVFGSDTSIELPPSERIELAKLYSVVSGQRTDIAGALRLAMAAFPENTQKRIVLVSDGNENMGDALTEALTEKSNGVQIDVVPVTYSHRGEVLVQKMSTPGRVKKGETFEAKIYVQSEQPGTSKLRLFRNGQYMGEQQVELTAGKNLFTFPQTLEEAGFYTYNVDLESANDSVPQNNHGVAFVNVRGEPRVLYIDSDPTHTGPLVEAMRSAKVVVDAKGLEGLPSSMAELQNYDSLVLGNVAAGDLSDRQMKWIESAVRDFGMGFVCIGGDNSYAAGGYRNTPLEEVLPVSMELSSKKVLPSGALAIVCHATEFPNGNSWARQIALAALESLGPKDQMGIVLWDGTDRWLFDVEPVGDKKAMRKIIYGMNPGDMPSFVNVMNMAHTSLKNAKAHLKHMVVFSDGDPQTPTPAELKAITDDKITISTVMIGGHVAPQNMIAMAQAGAGRFYDVRSADDLPQIFIKEAAVILKSAIFEEPFKPKVVDPTELIRGIAANEYPPLQGYVATTPKPRAEMPLVSGHGDPILAHWNFGLGRSVAFTSDSKPKWAKDWLAWGKWSKFWSQTVKWSVRSLEVTDYEASVSIEGGKARLTVDAVDAQGNYMNFLPLQAVVVSPKGDSSRVELEQKGPGRYEVEFPASEVGAYMMNVGVMKDGQQRTSQILGAAVSYSPEFQQNQPNDFLLRKLAETTGGKVLDPRKGDNPFAHDRVITRVPRDIWESLFMLAICLLPVDVGIRRIMIEREQMLKAWNWLLDRLPFLKRKPKLDQRDEAMEALLARKAKVREQVTQQAQARTELFQPTGEAADVAGAKVESGERKGEEAEHRTSNVERPTSKEAPEQSDYTKKLLEAKRRAQKK